MAYITTPIYYVNDDPHIGHLYTTLSADVLTRFFNLIGEKSYLLSGTDEHAVKVVEAANNNNMSVFDWAEKKAAAFSKAFDEYQINVSDFIRTSEKRHVAEVEKRVRELLATGDIYLGSYEGWYDKGQEEYISDHKAKESDYVSVFNKKPLVRRKEPCLFFKLSKYADPIKKLIEEDTLKVRPLSRKNEILARFVEGINDVPCSRPRTDEWGVAVPGYEDQTVYVWIDALLNYLTSVDTEGRRNFWPPDIQIVGKDILWFHAVIWPAMLLALQNNPNNKWIQLPKIIKAHGFWVRDGEKMSKSMGNFISLPVLNEYVAKYGLDSIRFYLMHSGPNESSDANFSDDNLHTVHTTMLANTIGNSCSRVITMICKYCDEKTPSNKVKSGFAIKEVEIAVSNALASAKNGEFQALINEALKITRIVDSFIQETSPFKLAKEEANKDLVDAILYDCLEALRLVSVMLWPVMPTTIGKMWSAFSYQETMKNVLANQSAQAEKIFEWGSLKSGLTVSKLEPLFPRVE